MDSMEEIYKQHAKIVYKFLFSKCQCEQVAEELMQETFYRAIRSIDKFQGNSTISTWLCGIAKNVLKEHYRKNKHYEQLDERILAKDNFEEELEGKLQKVELLKEIHSLNDPEREVVYLRMYGNLSYKEIGEIFGKSENWCRIVFYRGKEKLRKVLVGKEKRNG